jgi:hypothetical protein
MTAPHRFLLQQATRYTFTSSVEGPLTVEAPTIERALYLGLLLVERDHRVEDLSFHRGEDGELRATDLLRGERFAVRAIAA